MCVCVRRTYARKCVLKVGITNLFAANIPPVGWKKLNNYNIRVDTHANAKNSLNIISSQVRSHIESVQIKNEEK